MSAGDPVHLPRAFGRYVLTHVIGEGGMAEVYCATVRVAEGLTKRVVIKKIRKEFADQADFTRMFVDEAKIALLLNHANIVQVFDFGQVRGDFYLAMELVEGVDLMRLFHAVNSQGDAFPPVIAAYLGHQVCAGLSYAHRKKDEAGRPLDIVHRDVSPHNIMVTYDGQVKILDFGIARTKARGPEPDPLPAERAASGEDTGEETIKGKVAYMSPEQALGQAVDARSDLYSLGVVLHELLTGELLFRDKDRLAALERVRSEPIPPVQSIAPHVPDELAAIVDRALARDPNDRFDSARAMRSALASYLHSADPVVDDEVLASFIAEYTADQGQAPAASQAALDDQPTRELGDSHASHPPLGFERERHRVLAVQVALEPRAEGGTAAAAAAGDPDRFFELVHNLAFKREAVIVHEDARGALLVVGAVLSTGDDADKALRLALALRDDLPEAAPGFAVGTLVASVPATIHHGGGSSVRVELRPAVRDLLDRVARRAMEGPVLVSQDLVDRLSRSWRLGAPSFGPAAPGDSEPVALPEISEPAPLLGPASAAARQPITRGGRTRLLGRELELKLLRDTFSESIRSREARALLVVGAPGIGKRALVDRFVASIPRSACWILRATATWSRRNVPMGLFLDMLTRFLRVEHGTPRADVARALQQHDIREADELAEALALALGLADAPDEPIAPLELRDRIWRLVRRLVRALARRRPVLILIDNAHFLDPQSMEMLEQWIQVPHPLPVLGLTTARPGAHVDTLSRLPRVSTLRLSELGPQVSRDLIMRRFEDPKAAEPLAEAIVARTGGNPLFIEETLATLLHRGVVGWGADGRFLRVLRPGADVELPPTIEGALQGRLEDLAPPDREVLQAAAILGRTFRTGELTELLERSVRPSLDVLLARGLLEPDAHAGTSEQLRFPTLSLHEVVRASPPEDLAALWHGRAADLKLAREDFRPGRDDGPVADHLVAAGRLAEAVGHALVAAHEASRTQGNRAAYYHLTQALDAMAPDDPRRFDALLEREDILRAWGRRRARGGEVRAMLELAESSHNPDWEAKALLRLLRLYVDAERLHRAERLLPRIEAHLSSMANADTYRPALARLHSGLLLARGQFEEAEAVARQALPLCGDDEAGARRRCRLYNAIGRVLLDSGRFEDARHAYAQALDIARDLGDLRLSAEVRNALGEVAGRSTRYQEAIDHFKAALAIDRDLGDRVHTGRKLANLGITYGAIGLHRRAERYLRKALELHEAMGAPGELNDVVVHLGETLANMGELDPARTILEDAARIARRRGDVRTELRAQTRLALSLAEKPRDDADRTRARDLASWALSVSQAQGLRTAGARAHFALARLDEVEGDLPQAITHAEQAVALTRAGAAPVERPRYLHALGRLLQCAGEVDRARELLEEAAAAVRARLDELRDPDLRRGYGALPEVRQILGA